MVKGQRPEKRPPARLSSTCSPITLMSAASLTVALICSREDVEDMDNQPQPTVPMPSALAGYREEPLSTATAIVRHFLYHAC